MIYSKCENILNINILVSTHKDYGSNGGRSKPFPHYENFSALEASANLGCKLCRLGVSALKRHPPVDIRVLVGDEAKLYFEFAPDDLVYFTTAGYEICFFKPALFTGIQLSVLEGMSSLTVAFSSPY